MEKFTCWHCHTTGEMDREALVRTSGMCDTCHEKFKNSILEDTAPQPGDLPECPECGEANVINVKGYLPIVATSRVCGFCIETGSSVNMLDPSKASGEKDPIVELLEAVEAAIEYVEAADTYSTDPAVKAISDQLAAARDRFRG